MDTRVVNGVLKSYLFPEQPNLEDEISLRGKVCNNLVFGPFLFPLNYLIFDLFFFLEWLYVLATWEIIIISSPK